MRTGIEPISKGDKLMGVKHINYKPTPAKAMAERAHLRDAHNSMQGPTMDNSNFCMKPTDLANKQTHTEYTQEGTMT